MSASLKNTRCRVKVALVKGVLNSGIVVCCPCNCTSVFLAFWLLFYWINTKYAQITNISVNRLHGLCDYPFNIDKLLIFRSIPYLCQYETATGVTNWDFVNENNNSIIINFNHISWKIFKYFAPLIEISKLI